MRVLVCPQEFKGSLTAAEAARALAAGVRAAMPDAEILLLPLADGGPGTVAIISSAADGTLVTMTARGPLGALVRAAYALLPPHPKRGQTAVIEAAATAGLVLIPAERREPWRASTFGVGEQIRAALAAGVREVTVGVGGTGTNDGGAGAAQALGYRLLNARGEPIGPGPRELMRLDRIDTNNVEPLPACARVRVAVDVQNRLLGPEGATRVFGPQKGVTPELADECERALERWAQMVARDIGVDIANIEGGGAGGGLAAGLAAVCAASIESGAALVGEAVGLARAVASADVIVTGEGRLDTQTAYGKTVAYVAEIARQAGRPCLTVAGSIEAQLASMQDSEAAMLAGEPIEVAIAHASERVQAAAERLMRRYRA